VAFDVDHDGKSDLTLTPDANGKVSMTSLLAAIGSGNSTTLTGLAGGLIMVDAWPTGAASHTDDHVTFPIVYQKNLTQTELAAYQATQQEFARKYVEYQTAADLADQASQSGNYAVETQYADGTSGGGTSGGTGIVSTFDTGLTQPDIMKLTTALVPDIPLPAFSGELVAVENGTVPYPLLLKKYSTMITDNKPLSSP